VGTPFSGDTVFYISRKGSDQQLGLLGIRKEWASVSYLPSNHQLETKDLPQHLILHATVVEDNMR